MAVTDTQSYGWVIRNIFFDAVSALPIFTGFTKRKTKWLAIQSQSIPYLGVYWVGERMSPDGDGNAGAVAFKHMLRIGFSIVIANNDADTLETKLDQMMWAVSNRLFPDQYIMNMLDTFAYGAPGPNNNPDNVRIESISGVDWRRNWGAAALNNEMPNAEVAGEITVMFRSMWTPVITDDLTHVHIETVPLATDEAGESYVPPAEEVERVIQEITIPTE
jgi:hypothetical protein